MLASKKDTNSNLGKVRIGVIRGKKWVRMRPIRTAAACPPKHTILGDEIRRRGEISLHIRIDPANPPPLYQRISLKVKRLRALKMSFYEIADKLQVHLTTVLKAYYFSKK